MQPGSPIPDATLPDQNGEARPLRALLGEHGAVIYFYPKDSTPGCTLEAHDFQSLLPRFLARGVTVIGVSKDSPRSHANFCAKQGLGFTLLSDQDGELCEGFGVWQEKTRCGKTCWGIVRSTFVVDGAGVVRQVYANVQAKGHAAQVLDSLG